jgi:hypothetical protein
MRISKHLVHPIMQQLISKIFVYVTVW